MAENSFYKMFVDQLRDLFDAENQIVQNLPSVIQSASHKELKEALSQHLDETKNQVQRLKKIFKTLNENPTGKTCQAMTSLLAEGKEAVEKNVSSAVKDACLIIGCQKIEHYEISTYGSARALAHHLNDAATDDRVDYDEIADLLQQSLDEEVSADETLTDLAEGGFFSQGINEEAQKLEESKSGAPAKSRSKTPLV